jgi:hypothetical protein
MKNEILVLKQLNKETKKFTIRDFEMKCVKIMIGHKMSDLCNTYLLFLHFCLLEFYFKSNSE